MNSLKDSINYLSKRCDKIATAIYVLTNHIKDNEPMKWSVRENVMKLLSFIKSLSETRDGERQSVADASIRIIEVVAEEISMSSRVGLISQSNAKIVNDEINIFAREIAEFRAKDGILSPIQKEYMKVDIGRTVGAIRETSSLKDKVKDIFENKGQSKGHYERKEIILNMLKSKDRVSIKDITVSIKNCSEKTIQRELNSMIKEGVLYKVGDRRWSTYSLVKRASV